MTTATKTARCAEYKGRKYRLLWLGKTKYGFRAHLAFMDGSKDFWCDGNAVLECSSGSGYTPAVRNERGYVTERGHYEGYCGYPCPVTGKKCCPENGPCHDCE
jgi:hypothetical protein